MRNAWKDEDISKALREISKAPTGNVVFDRVWFKIEEKLSSVGKPWWHSFVWRPWAHPVRWVMAGCLCLALAAGLQYRILMDQADLVAFLECLSNPTEEVTADDGIVQASVLLSDTSSLSSDESIYPDDEDWSQPLLENEGELL